MSKVDTPETKSRANLGSSTILPEGARKILSEAAAAHNSIILDNAIDEVKRKYPSFFKTEALTEEQQP